MKITMIIKHEMTVMTMMTTMTMIIKHQMTMMTMMTMVMTTKTSGTQHSCEFSEIRSDNYAKDNDDKNADDDENDDNLDKNDLNRLILGIPLNHTKMTKVMTIQILMTIKMLVTPKITTILTKTDLNRLILGVPLNHAKVSPGVVCVCLSHPEQLCS